MKPDTTACLPEQAFARLDPGRVQQYVRATGWAHEARLGKGRVAVFERPESRLKQVRVPLTQDFSDFAVLMAEAVAAVANWEGRPALQLLQELLLPPADVLRFSESGPGTDAGNLPLAHGVELLAGVRKALVAAACSAVRPQRFYPRLGLAEADQFLQQCRLGQTERDSFTLTVICALDSGPDTPALFEGGPFVRRVTTLLMRSLQEVAQAVESGSVEAPRDPGGREVILSANFCEGLLDMTPEGEGSALTVSARWEPTLPLSAEDSAPATIRLGRESFPRIETLAARLRPPRTQQQQTLMGFVDTLDGRPNADGRREGPVTLQVATPEGEVLRARADLDATAYHIAWQAHGENYPVILHAILRRGGRLHRLENVADFRLFREVQAPQTEGA